MKRVSPSMAVALLALFVALGGTGYAAAKINGRNIIDRSIPGTKLAAQHAERGRRSASPDSASVPSRRRRRLPRRPPGRRLPAGGHGDRGQLTAA